MDKLVWDEEAYATGFETIDKQHQKLFEFINELGDNIETAEAQDEIEAYLSFLSDYIKNHFGQEENCMAANHCPFAQKNCDAHNKFIKAYENFEERFRSGDGSMDLIVELHTMLRNWTVHHICRIDSHMRECYTDWTFADASS